MKPSDRDRSQILRRRAALVGSTLAALGCSPAAAGPSEPNAPQVAVPNSDTDAGSEPTAPPPSRAPGAFKFSEPRPPLSVPDGLSETAKQNWEHLVKSIDGMVAASEKIEASLAKQCRVTDPACEDEWRGISEAWLEIQRIRQFMYFCPGSSEEAKRFAEELKRQQEYVERRLAFDKAEQAKALEGGGQERYQEIDADVRSSKPMVCLSFGCSDW